MRYKDAGVDIDKGEALVERIKKKAKRIGGFGGTFPIPKGYKEPFIVASTDSVGTKLKIAYMVGRHNTVGEDIVNHCVNDILAVGASPLFFMDYIGTSKLDLNIAEKVIEGIQRGCDKNDVELLGGETAELPGYYPDKEYDLVGFIVGIVEKSKIIDGKTIKADDKLIGLASSGLHTNGYSLARKILKVKNIPLDFYLEECRCEIGEELLKIHRSYKKAINPVLDKIKGIAHITGGGFFGNIPRIIPKGLGVKINKKAWEIPPIFRFIQKEGSVSEQEMFRVFNMGIGMIIVVDAKYEEEIRRKIKEKTYAIGEIVKKEGVTLVD
jgi:phosphoribosylformylglycinamidine cyclo-ligase